MSLPPWRLLRSGRTCADKHTPPALAPCDAVCPRPVAHLHLELLLWLGGGLSYGASRVCPYMVHLCHSCGRALSHFGRTVRLSGGVCCGAPW